MPRLPQDRLPPRGTRLPGALRRTDRRGYDALGATYAAVARAPCNSGPRQSRWPRRPTGASPAAYRRGHGTWGTGWTSARRARRPRPTWPGCAAWTPTPWAPIRRPRRSSGPRCASIPRWPTAGSDCTRCASTPPTRCSGCTATGSASASSAPATAAPSTPGTGGAGGCSRCWRAPAICCSRTPPTGSTAATSRSWTGPWPGCRPWTAIPRSASCTPAVPIWSRTGNSSSGTPTPCSATPCWASRPACSAVWPGSGWRCTGRPNRCCRRP